MADGVWGNYSPYGQSSATTKSYFFVDELTNKYTYGNFGYTDRTYDDETYAKISQDHKTLSYYSKKYDARQYNDENITYRYWVIG